MTIQQLRSRRDFLRLGCRTISTVGAAAAFGKAGLMTARAQSSGNYQAIVCIFLFGGNDANNMLVPNDAVTYANYQKIRQNLALPQSSLVTIHDPATNADYGLHPSFAPIAPLYNSNGLPNLTSVPLPVNLYSHSDQQNEWQNAVPQGGATTGWSGRLADKLAGGSGTLVPPCISISGNTLQLIGENTQPSTVNTSNFGLVAPATDPGSTALLNMLSLSSGVTLIQAAQSSLKDAIAVAQAVNAAVAGSSSLGVTFANTDIGTQLAQVAKLIQVRAALGATRQIFFCSQGGYDTHSNQLPQQVTLFTNLANAMAAFDQAMGLLTVQSNVTTFTESDFNRTFQPNGNAGTDHGWGSHALIMGGAVNGGNLYGTFPILTLAGPDDSTNRGTWVPSTSEDQYAGALAKWFGLSAQADLDYVFPNLRNFNYQTPAFI
ncbi:MAG: DUF1501 domain-containing protein [Bryobacteraceae bacterium]